MKRLYWWLTTCAILLEARGCNVEMLPTRVFFDARFIRLGHHDGISRFSVGLANALVKLIPVTAIIYDSAQLRELDPAIEHIFANDPTKAGELGLAKLLNRAGAEIVYSPMNTTGSLGRRFKLILSQHDMIYFKHRKPPVDLSLPLRLGWRLFHLTYWPQRFTLSRGDALVTVSETSKKEMKDARLFRGEITVIYNASGSEGEISRSPVEHSQRKKLIYMGSFMPYKNVETLVRGMSKLPDLELHLLSRVPSRRRRTLQRLASGAGGSVIWHDGVSDSEYHGLLDSALALVTASFDEGFGIPIIEAQSRGIPVVVSDIPIFHEVAGPDSLYFAPNSPDEFSTMVKTLQNPAVWSSASKSAKSNADRFGWHKSAEALLSLIRKL